MNPLRDRLAAMRGKLGADRIPWLVQQQWLDLLMAHWPISPEVLQPHLPSPLTPDVAEGSAWITVVPFAARQRIRGLPALPGLRTFNELNVRTYVTVDGRPGVHFLDIDANNTAVVAGARAALALPYHAATVSVLRRGATVEYDTRRNSGGEQFVATARVLPGTTRAPEGLAAWLANRFWIHTVPTDGTVLTAQVEHPPWRLTDVDLSVRVATVLARFGLDGAEPALAHVGEQHDVRLHPPFPRTGRDRTESRPG